MITQRLIEILDELKGVINQQGLQVSSEVLLEQACMYHRGELANSRFNQPIKSGIVKPTGEKAVTKDSDFSNNSPKLATSKQLAYAQQLSDDLGLNTKINNNLSSKEVSELIKELNNKKYSKGGKQ